MTRVFVPSASETSNICCRLDTRIDRRYEQTARVGQNRQLADPLCLRKDRSRIASVKADFLDRPYLGALGLGVSDVIDRATVGRILRVAEAYSTRSFGRPGQDDLLIRSVRGINRDDPARSPYRTKRIFPPSEDTPPTSFATSASFRGGPPRDDTLKERSMSADPVRSYVEHLTAVRRDPESAPKLHGLRCDKL